MVYATRSILPQMRVSRQWKLTHAGTGAGLWKGCFAEPGYSETDRKAAAEIREEKV